jgi:pilus assembly protein CpaB
MIIGVLAAVAAGLMVYYVSSVATAQANRPVEVAPTATPIPVQQVVLAARDIPARTLITAADVVTREYPVALVPGDAFTDVADVVSQTAMALVFAGEILMERQFVEAGGHTGASSILPEGKVLVAFPATDMLNATGAVREGDRVDILISLPISGTATLSDGAPAQQSGGEKALVTQATMQNIEVYSTGIWSPDGATTSGEGLKVITFIVDRQEALILKYIKDSGGTIDLVVRSVAEEQAETTDPVSLDYLVDLYRFVNGSR